MITFGAKYITSVDIQKTSRKSGTTPYKAAFVELNPESKLDLFTMSILLHAPKSRNNYVSSIYYNFTGTEIDDTNNANNSKFFALIKEQKNYKFVNPLNVLGLAETGNSIYCEDTVFLKHLQTIPKYFFRKLNHVGSGLLEGLKKFAPQKDIMCNSVVEAVPFYLKNGFIKMGDVIDDCLVKMQYYAKK